jgi:hypothetical protein
VTGPSQVGAPFGSGRLPADIGIGAGHANAGIGGRAQFAAAPPAEPSASTRPIPAYRVGSPANTTQLAHRCDGRSVEIGSCKLTS